MYDSKMGYPLVLDLSLPSLEANSLEEPPSESVEDIARATLFLRFCREDLAPEAFNCSVPSLEDISKWETNWLVESATPVPKEENTITRTAGSHCSCE